MHLRNSYPYHHLQATDVDTEHSHQLPTYSAAAVSGKTHRPSLQKEKKAPHFQVINFRDIIRMRLKASRDKEGGSA